MIVSSHVLVTVLKVCAATGIAEYWSGQVQSRTYSVGIWDCWPEM